MTREHETDKNGVGVSLRDVLATVAGKLSIKAIRLFGVGMGSNFPGRLARMVSSEILAKLSNQAKLGTMAVTGTNGKSTTTGLIASILRSSGYRLIHNRQGANLVTGITATLVECADWRGEIKADFGLFEIDEAALPVVAKEIKLDTVLVTNLFRDQLDRFGELDTTAKLITAGIKLNNSRAILNADDPNVSQLALDTPRFFYGVENLKHKIDFDDRVERVTRVERLVELSYCSVCGAEITYTSYTYGQLGDWHCSRCNHKRPMLDFFATDVEVRAADSRFSMGTVEKKVDVALPLPGLFNVYNAVAAGAAAFAYGVSLDIIKKGLDSYHTLFGRSERVTVIGKQVIIQLIKNPVGATQALHAVRNSPTFNVLIAINDNLADGRDVSWLWDADFECLSNRQGKLFVSGKRAEDMAVRLKYAGIEESKIVCLPPLDKAVQAALDLTSEEGSLWILPTYTCLLEMRNIFRRLDVVLSES